MDHYWYDSEAIHELGLKEVADWLPVKSKSTVERDFNRIFLKRFETKN
jgi:hypothetical protein